MLVAGQVNDRIASSLSIGHFAECSFGVGETLKRASTSRRTYQNANTLNLRLLTVLYLMIGHLQLCSSWCLLSESIAA